MAIVKRERGFCPILLNHDCKPTNPYCKVGLRFKKCKIYQSKNQEAEQEDFKYDHYTGED